MRISKTVSLRSSTNIFKCIETAPRGRKTCRRNSRMSEKLQLQADLMLESTKKSIRQRKPVKEQWQELHGESRKGHAVMEDMTRRSTRKPLCDMGWEEVPAKTAGQSDKTTETRVLGV